MTNFNILVELQKETVGCNFTISFSLKKNQCFLYLNNKRMCFKHDDINVCIQQAIEYILNNRVEHPAKKGLYTIHNYEYRK